MIKSMTGYGSSSGEAGGIRLTLELKSVNNRFLDTSVRMPRNFMFAEESIKGAVQKHISRGKVDMFVTIDASGADDVAVSVNEPLLRGYIAALQSISLKYGLQDDMTLMAVSRLPDVISIEKKDLDKESAEQGLVQIAERALCDFDAMREREGEKLRDDVLARTDEIERLVAIVEESSAKTVADYRARLEQKLREVLNTAGIEENRIITEAAIFADRVAVDEETVRLRSHLSQLRGMVEGESPIGRKMDFLVQELNREANTIGSKSQSADIAHVVVDLKSEIEKIREQIQNVE